MQRCGENQCKNRPTAGNGRHVDAPGWEGGPSVPSGSMSSLGAAGEAPPVDVAAIIGQGPKMHDWGGFVNFELGRSKIAIGAMTK